MVGARTCLPAMMMTDYFIALRLPVTEDLADFSRLLWQRGVAHHISEDSGSQVLRVGDREQVAIVQGLYKKLHSGELSLGRAAPLVDVSLASRPAPSPGRPMVLLLLLLSVLGALLPVVDRSFSLVSYLSFYPLDLDSGRLVASWPSGQLWRLLTPMFLHFGVLHIAFNGLWLWELGGMIERRQGAATLLAVVVLVAASSNMAQAMMSVSLFGGMSGVIYGLLGYILAWNQLRRAEALPLVPGVAVVMLVWLLLCLAGFTRLLGLGEIANTAHVSGLLMGLLLGAAAAFLRRRPA